MFNGRIIAPFRKNRKRFHHLNAPVTRSLVTASRRDDCANRRLNLISHSACANVSRMRIFQLIKFSRSDSASIFCLIRLSDDRRSSLARGSKREAARSIRENKELSLYKITNLSLQAPRDKCSRLAKKAMFAAPQGDARRTKSDCVCNLCEMAKMRGRRRAKRIKSRDNNGNNNAFFRPTQ